MQNKNDKKYKFGRDISTTIFNITLNPLIINSEIIPKEGSIVFCGNHLHVWDQFPVMCATHRTIHWMAKKEYFEGKLGPVFKYMQCIPVDRQGDASKSKEIAIEYLKQGSAIGIFPEGTRNGLKDNKIKELYDKYYSDSIDIEDFKEMILNQNPRLSQVNFLQKLYNDGIINKVEFLRFLYDVNESLKLLLNENIITDSEYDNSLLLDFHFGAVSMAKKTNSLIVPYGVTGDYKIGNKNLTVSFGKPMDITNLSMEDANNLLKDKVLNLVKNNIKYTK